MGCCSTKSVTYTSEWETLTVENWSPTDVASWLRTVKNGSFRDVAPIFMDFRITGMSIPKLTEAIVRNEMRCPYGFCLAWESLKKELLETHDASLNNSEGASSGTNVSTKEGQTDTLPSQAQTDSSKDTSKMEERMAQQISYSKHPSDETHVSLKMSEPKQRQPTTDFRKTSSVDSGVSEIVPRDANGVSSYMIRAADEWIDPAAEAIAQRQRFHSTEETVNDEDNYVSLDTGDLETLGSAIHKSMAVGTAGDVSSSGGGRSGGTTQLAMLQDDIVVVTADSLPVSSVAGGLDKTSAGAATPELEINYEDLDLDMSPSPSGLTATSVVKTGPDTDKKSLVNYDLTFVIPSEDKSHPTSTREKSPASLFEQRKDDSDRINKGLQSIDDLAKPLDPITGLEILGQSKRLLYEKSSHIPVGGAGGGSGTDTTGAGSGTDEEIDEEYTTLHTEDFDQTLGRPDSVTAKILPVLPLGKDGFSGSRNELIGPATTADDELEPAGLDRHQSVAVSKQDTMVRPIAEPTVVTSPIRPSAKFGSGSKVKLPRHGSTPYATGVETHDGGRAKLTDHPTFSADGSEPLGVQKFEPMMMDPSMAEGGLGMSPEATPEASPEESHVYDFAHDLWFRLGSISVDSRADKITGKVKKGFTGLSLMAHIEEHLKEEALLCAKNIPDTINKAYGTVTMRRRVTSDTRRETQLFIGLCQLLVENGYIRPVLVSELKRDIQSAAVAASSSSSRRGGSSAIGGSLGSEELPQLPLGSVSMKEWISSNHIFCPSEIQLYQFESEKHRIFIMSDQPDRQAWNVGCYVMIQSQTLQSWTRAHVSDIDSNGNLIVVYGSGDQQMKKMVDRCQEDVKSTDDFLLWRNSLKLGSELQIYSQTLDQWCVGQISQVLAAHSTQKYEIFHVVYNRDGKQFAKFVGKWSPAIRKVVRISEEMARFPIGTEVAIYSRSKDEWLKGVVKQCFFDQDTVSVDYGDRQKNIHVSSEHIMLWKDYEGLKMVHVSASPSHGIKK